MINRDKFNLTDRDESRKYAWFTVIDDNVLETVAKEMGTTVEEMVKELSVFKVFKELWDYSDDEAISKLKQWHICFCEFFTWGTYGYKPFFTVKDALFTTENKWVRGVCVAVKKYHDVMLVESQYANVEMYNAHKHAFFARFSSLSATFSTEVDRYTTEQKKWLKSLDLGSRLETMPDCVRKGLTAGEFCRCVNDKDFVDSKTMRTDFTFYTTTLSEDEAKRKELDIYLGLGKFTAMHEDGTPFHEYEYSLYIPFKALIENDFSLIEEKMVFSMPTPKAKEFFDGKQKEMWYFDKNPKVKALREFMDAAKTK